MTVYYGNELYHHGIKGQKWGVRRFQNEDGSYTLLGKQRYGYGSGDRLIREAKYKYKNSSGAERKVAKKEYKEAKQVGKLIKYRDKLARKSSRRARLANVYADESDEELKDLKENGAKSKVYQQYMADRAEEQYSKYANDQYDIYGNRTSKGSATLGLIAYAGSLWTDRALEDSQVRDMIVDREQNSKMWREEAETWTKRNQAVMNMSIDAITSKKDIKRAYKRG